MFTLDRERVPAEILLATYNGGAYLREQLDSILRQSDSRWHLTISDDGSTDNTDKIIRRYVSDYPDRIALVHSGRTFGNARDNFFFLMSQCDAPYLLFCDQDDVWYPQKVSEMLRALQKAEKIYPPGTPLLVFSDLVPTDATLKTITPSLSRYQKQFVESFDYRSLLMQNVITGCAMGINRSLKVLAEQCEDYRNTLMHDWWLGLVAARFGQVVYLKEPTVYYRQHRDNAVGVKNVGSPAYIFSMLTRWKTVSDTIRGKKRQAACFRSTYTGVLNAVDLAFLHSFEKPRSGVRFYWQNRALFHSLNRLVGFMILG